MARRAPALAIRAAGLAAALAACAPTTGPEPEPVAQVAGHQFSFQDVLVPGAYAHVGPASVAPGEAAPGLWAAAPGLARAERGRIVNPATGAAVDVALYRGRGAIRLSPEAGEALGIGARPVQVQVTALRREPKITVGPAPQAGARPRGG